MRRDFAQVYEDHVWDVYAFLAYRVRDRVEAEDLTQLTFERALRAWDRFDASRASAARWLLAIARNLLIDHYRRDRAGRERSAEPEELDDSVQGTVPGPEAGLGIAPELQGALAGLSDREREVVALRYGGDLSGPEIASMLDLSLANVQQITSRALRKMRSAIESGDQLVSDSEHVRARAEARLSE